MSKLNAIAIIALIVFLLLAGFIGYSLEQRRHAGIMQTQLQGKAAELDRQLAQLAVVPRLLSRNPIITRALKSPVSHSLHAANEALLAAQQDSNAAFAFLMDLQGETLASSNFRDEVSFVGRNYGFRPYFRKALAPSEATFFAVGATTGVPGYFVANPVFSDRTVAGVVVVKFNLDHLAGAWKLQPYQWVVVDEYGVVILSTNADYLYAQTRDLSLVDKDRITSDRKYKLSDARFTTRENAGRYVGGSGEQSFFVQQFQTASENWSLQLLVDKSYIVGRVTLYMLALLSVLALAALVYRNNKTQKDLAASEKRHARQLEVKVQQRTEELRSAQQSLISESNYAMLGRMSGAINHEINQPLASLRLNLATLRQLIEMPDRDMAEIQQIVVDSDRTTKRIGRVITTLRNLTNQKRTDHAEVKVSRLISEVSETIARERPSMSRCLSVFVHQKLPAVRGSEVLLQQAALNLLYNAFDAVIDVSAPSVNLSATAVGDNIQIEVTDNGCGVSDVVLADLFKPFVSDKTRKSGLGLGLTLVELIAKDHGGSLQYKPVTEDAAHGSIFTLTIPAVPAETL